MKHVPLRTCVGCGSEKPKRELVRLVRVPQAQAVPPWQVEVDPTGRRAGRGVYLCKALACWKSALKKKSIERSLKIILNLEGRAKLETLTRTLEGQSRP